MKLKIFKRAVLLPALAGCTLLSSCHSTLHRAVERNDIYTLRSEIFHAKKLSQKDKIEYLRGHPPAANLCWVIPTGMITVPVDICLLVGTLGLYAAMENYWLTDIMWYKFYNNTPDAVNFSFEKQNYHLTYELMEAGADTSADIRDWMYKNYWRYQSVEVEAPPPPPKKAKPKNTTRKQHSEPASAPIGVGESISRPGS